VVSAGVVTGASIAGALRADTGESMSGKLAVWARSWHLGWLVDTAERVVYRNAPDGEAARELEIEGGEPVPAPSSDAVETTVVETTVATTLPDAVPSVITPALDGEGVWKPLRMVGGEWGVWSTGVRPSAKFGAIQASFLLVDQTRTRAVLQNGTEVPGGTWQRKNSVPAGEVPGLVAAFNGGFLRKHSMGGYYTEGREAWPLREGAATLAIDAEGRVHVGEWGTQLDPAGFGGAAWVSARQNLTMLVKDGVVFPKRLVRQWGASGKGELWILRSAVCERTDGKLLYAIVGKTDAMVLAKTLRNAGCKNAMQLDVNASYPRGYWFDAGVPKRLDRRMVGRDDLYLSGSYREFIALFER
jgi:hypothetical protein